MKRLHEETKESKETPLKKLCLVNDDTQIEEPLENLFQFKHYFAFWDVESTDKKPSESDIISIGCVLCEYEEGFVRPQQFHTFVNTTKAINLIAESVHHIHKSDLVDAPYFPDAIKLWKKWILEKMTPGSKLIITGHNSFGFDDLILFCNFKQHRLDYEGFLNEIFVNGFMDTLQVLKIWFKSKPLLDKPKQPVTGKVSFALGNCYHTWIGHELTGAHNALTDSQALYDIFTCPVISKMFTLVSLFTNIRTKKKHIKHIKKSVGIAFLSIEERTKLETADEMEIESEPIWDDDNEEDLESKRLCLNCMLMYHQTDHLTCTLSSQKCKIN
jgi:DNA polymerase III epsilon subunit-like protein